MNLNLTYGHSKNFNFLISIIWFHLIVWITQVLWFKTGSVSLWWLISLKMLALFSSCNSDWCSYITSLLKQSQREIKPWLILWIFFPLRFLFISITVPSAHAWNTIVMSGLMLLLATWICWVSHKNILVGLLVLYLFLILNTWLIVVV